jgi:hypothetical protein
MRRDDLGRGQWRKRRGAGGRRGLFGCEMREKRDKRGRKRKENALLTKLPRPKELLRGRVAVERSTREKLARAAIPFGDGEEAKAFACGGGGGKSAAKGMESEEGRTESGRTRRQKMSGRVRKPRGGDKDEVSGRSSVLSSVCQRRRFSYR